MLCSTLGPSDLVSHDEEQTAPLLWVDLFLVFKNIFGFKLKP